MKQVGLKEPVFESDTFLRAIFYRNPEYVLKRIPEVTEKSIQKGAQKILAIIRENKYVARAELAHQIVGLSGSGVKKHLKKLQAEGILKRIGPDEGGYWEVVK